MLANRGKKKRDEILLSLCPKVSSYFIPSKCHLCATSTVLEGRHSGVKQTPVAHLLGVTAQQGWLLSSMTTELLSSGCICRGRQTHTDCPSGGSFLALLALVHCGSGWFQTYFLCWYLHLFGSVCQWNTAASPGPIASTWATLILLRLLGQRNLLLSWSLQQTRNPMVCNGRKAWWDEGDVRVCVTRPAGLGEHEERKREKQWS